MIDRLSKNIPTVTVALICLTLVYALVYANSPLSIDGADTLDVASTLWHHGTPEATRLTTARQLIVADGAGNEQYLLTSEGLRYSKKGIVPSVLLLPAVAIQALLHQLGITVSLRALAMWLNPLVTLATAGLLGLMVQRMGASARLAGVIMLSYGLGTLALAYTKTLFGEPLAGLLILSAVFISYRHHQRPQLGDAFLAGGALALAVGVNFSYGAMLPIVGIYLAWRPFRARQWARVMQLALVYSAPMFIIAIGIGWLNIVRFGAPLETGYYLNDVEGFTTPIMTGIIGNWLSFYKGIVWYSPWLIVSAFGAWYLRRQDAPLMAVCLALITAQTVIYGTWWAWDGAWSWGARFLVPVIPLLLIMSVPAWQRWGVSYRGYWALGVLFVCSVALQLPTALFDYIAFFREYYTGALFAPENHMILSALWHWRSQNPPEPAILQAGLDGAHLLAVIGTGAVCAVLIRASIRWQPAIVLTLVAMMGFITIRQSALPSYQLVQALDDLRPSGTMFIPSFRFDERLLDVALDERVIVTNPNAMPDNARVRAQFERAQSEAPFLWLVTWFAPTDVNNWYERELWTRHASVATPTNIGDPETGNHRAIAFYTRPHPSPTTPMNWRFGDIALTHLDTIRTPEGVHLALSWARQTRPLPASTWFVHLVGADGAIVQQQDRAPQGGYAPTTDWQLDEPVIDRLFFPLALEVDLRDFHWRIGWVDVMTGQPLTAFVAGIAQEQPFLTLQVASGD